MEQKTESSLKDGIQNVPLNTFYDVWGRVLLRKNPKRSSYHIFKNEYPLGEAKVSNR